MKDSNKEKLEKLMKKYPSIFSLFLTYDLFPELSHKRIMEALGSEVMLPVFFELMLGQNEIERVLNEINTDTDEEEKED